MKFEEYSDKNRIEHLEELVRILREQKLTDAGINEVHGILTNLLDMQRDIIDRFTAIAEKFIFDIENDKGIDVMDYYNKFKEIT